MRRLLAALLILVCADASAERFGEMIVESQGSVGGHKGGTYHEYRFLAFNPTAEPHTVRIEVIGALVHTVTASVRASRTVVVAPRSSVLVSVPQYIVPGYVDRETLVEVDGGDATQLSLNRTTHSAGRFDVSRDVLIGRSVSSNTVLALIPNENIAFARRAEIAPASWSPNWLQYAGFSGAVMNARDWNELPRPVQAALLRWVSAGGSLTFIGMPLGLPMIRATDFGEIPAGHLGFGWICFLPESMETPPPTVVTRLQATWPQTSMDGVELMSSDRANTPVPLLESASLPVRSLFSLLIVFAVVGGPVNMVLLARKQRRVWIFLTLPLLAIITAVIVVGAVIASEGWVRIQKTVSLTLLDEGLGEAVTLGWTGVYATLPPDGKLRFESGTEVRPFYLTADSHTDWTEGQQFASGWVPSRLPSGFALRKAEPRRERLPVRREGGQLVALNGIGADIKELWVADEQGAVYTASNVAAGKDVVLTRTSEVVDVTTKDPARLFGPPSSWGSFYSRVSSAPRSALRPATYVAVIERSPFVEQALARPTRATSQAVVIGLMRGTGDAR